jgi:hypothetical protein
MSVLLECHTSEESQGQTPLETPPRLADLEQVVERGLRTIGRGVIEMGNALREIRDRRAYRETHRTWETYCRERWDIGRNYANKLIRAAALAEEMGTAVPTERAARALLADENRRGGAAAEVVRILGDAPKLMTLSPAERRYWYSEEFVKIQWHDRCRWAWRKMRRSLRTLGSQRVG